MVDGRPGGSGLLRRAHAVFARARRDARLQALSIPSVTPVRQRWERLQRLAASEAWRLETFDETRGLMIAARPSGDSREVREHLRVLLRNDRTEVAVQTEVLVDGEWDMRDLTCGKYEYARETAIAVELDATGRCADATGRQPSARSALAALGGRDSARGAASATMRACRRTPAGPSPAMVCSGRWAGSSSGLCSSS